MERATRGSRGPGRSAPEPEPGTGRKDLPDPDRDLTEPGRPAPDGNALCNMACLGNSAETCGGPNRLDLYQYSGASLEMKKWNFLGCYSDSVAARTLAHFHATSRAEAIDARCGSSGLSNFPAGDPSGRR
jgi:hypothetical protein